MTKDENWLRQEIKFELKDGLYVRTNYSDYDQWINLEDLDEIIKRFFSNKEDTQ